VYNHVFSLSFYHFEWPIIVIMMDDGNIKILYHRKAKDAVVLYSGVDGSRKTEERKVRGNPTACGFDSAAASALLAH
jgi:hypothetical protein